MVLWSRNNSLCPVRQLGQDINSLSIYESYVMLFLVVMFVLSLPYECLFPANCSVFVHTELICVS